MERESSLEERKRKDKEIAKENKARQKRLESVEKLPDHLRQNMEENKAQSESTS